MHSGAALQKLGGGMNFKRPYPVDALPPMLAATVKELCVNSNVQAELAAPLVLGVASLACQGAVDVARPNCEPSPCLLYTVVVSGSGTRKSTVLNKLLAPIREAEQELANQAAAKMPAYEAAMLAWDVRKKHMVAEIEKKAKKNESLTELQEQLSALMSERPLRPIAPKFVYEDPTPEAIVDGLCKTWHSAAMISSEGAGFFNGRPSSDLPMWNKLWDGAGLGMERVSRGSLFNNDARCGMILAVQEGPFQEFCESRGAQAMDIGFLARILISRPPRQINPRYLYDGQLDSKWFAVQQFQNRVKDLLLVQAKSYQEKCSARTVLELSSDARQIWIEAFNEIEGQMQPGGELAAVPGYASKIGENAARIAAVFHWFEGKEGEVDAEDISNALMICRWHTDEYLDCFGPPPHIPLECRDADTLERWLAENVWNTGRSQIRKNEILQFGPNQLRSKARLDNAINVMIGGNKVRIALSSNKTRIIELNPNLFPGIAWRCKVSASTAMTI
jgi:hypothetical protein